MPAGYDIAVVGGGLVGAAIGWGAAGTGARVAVLDEGDSAFRAARGNFGLVWVQSKGLGAPAYARWTRDSARLWPDFAATLEAETGIALGFAQRGGFHLCLGAEELAARTEMIKRLAFESPAGFEVEIVGRGELLRTLPAIGPRVSGASFCRQDGHVDPLALLRALHAGLQARGGQYVPNRAATAIVPRGGGIRIDTSTGPVEAAQVVLAAGLGLATLGRGVGLALPVRPVRGQILVTGRAAPFLHHPTTLLRQAENGTVLIGDSQEEVGADDGTTVPVIRAMAARAVATFPALAALPVVRAWGALRVMTPDGLPIYTAAPDAPHIAAIAAHSGVTLAAIHALRLGPALAAGALPGDRLPGELHAFCRERFHVHADRPPAAATR